MMGKLNETLKKKQEKKYFKNKCEKLVKYIDFKTDSTATFSHVTVAYCPFFIGGHWLITHGKIRNDIGYVFLMSLIKRTFNQILI